MRRRDLFRLASTSVAAFLVARYGAPEPALRIPVSMQVPARLRMTTQCLVTGEVRQAEWLIHRDGRWEPVDLAKTPLVLTP